METPTTWSPDFCGCVINVPPSAWGNTNENLEDVQILKRCPAHEAMGLNGKKLFLQVYRKESRPRMEVWSIIQKEFPNLPFEDFDCTFDTQRKMHLRLTKLTPQEIATLKTQLPKEVIIG